MVAFNFLKLLIDLKDGWCFKTPKWIIFSLNVYFVIQLREPGKYESKERRRRRRRIKKIIDKARSLLWMHDVNDLTRKSGSQWRDGGGTMKWRMNKS